MAEFPYDRSAVQLSPAIIESHHEAWDRFAKPGTWWTGAERIAIAERARALFAVRNTPPWLRQLPDTVPGLSPETVAVVDKIAVDAGNVDRAWADEAIEQIGDGCYVELIAVVAVAVMVDACAEAMGVDKTPFPAPVDGKPSRERPDGLGDIGAHVPAIDPFPAANVARALSLVPQATELFRGVSVPTYSTTRFGSLQWDTPLSRPQVELVASRVAALAECFY